MFKKLTSLTLLLPMFMIGCSQSMTSLDQKKLPDYAKHDDPVLRKKSKKLSFPLSEEDMRDVKILEAKFDSETNCAGLSASQIGISKAIIIFAVPDDPMLKKFRKDLKDTMPKTIWINPTYKPVGKAVSYDWEGCFSVPDKAVKARRYNKIRYTAFTVEGKKVTGIATGFLARVIQHEIDHVNGILMLDRVDNPKTDVMSLDDYKRMKMEAMRKEIAKEASIKSN